MSVHEAVASQGDSIACQYSVLRAQPYMILDSSMVEHSAVNRVVVGSSPTRGVKCQGMACRENPQTLMFTDFFVDKNILERDKMVHMAAKGSM